MVDLSNFKLIEKSENLAMYHYQQDLLNKLEEDNGENVIRLSILLTLSPVGDYAEALKILSYFSNKFSNIKLKIIENYFLMRWGNGANIEQLTRMIATKSYGNNEMLSLIHYLIAMQYKYSGNKVGAMDSIRLSVEAYSCHVNNLLMYSEYFKDSNTNYVKIAKSHLRSIQISGLESYTNPDIFIGEHISGIYRT